MNILKYYRYSSLYKQIVSQKREGAQGFFFTQPSNEEIQFVLRVRGKKTLTLPRKKDSATS